MSKPPEPSAAPELSLRAVNLNLIPILHGLLRECGVSRAAKTLNLAQPTVSAALARLREMFDDPLLMPDGRGMALSPRAKALLPHVEEACAALKLIWAPEVFEPAKARQNFTIVALDYGPLVVGPQLINALAEHAPGISVQFINPSEEAFEKVRNGTLDFQLIPSRILNRPELSVLHNARLLPDNYVAVVGPRHPLWSQESVSDSEISSHRHISFSPFYTSLLDPVFAPALGTPLPSSLSPLQERTVVARVEQLTVLPMLAVLTDSVVFVPRRLAMQFQPYLNLKIIGTPRPSGDIMLVWSELKQSDPAHRWFREFAVQVVKDDPA